MIHIYTGEGKGKTTAIFGLAMRASGHNLKVIIYQFLKPNDIVCGEEVSAKKLRNIKIVKFDQMHPIFYEEEAALSGAVEYELKKSVKKAMTRIEKAVFSGKYNVIILDEIVNVFDQNYICRDSFLELLKKVPHEIELVLTGRGDIAELEKFADYVTVMADKKHPFRERVNARRGIEY